jgi:hypothetical protein
MKEGYFSPAKSEERPFQSKAPKPFVSSYSLNVTLLDAA